MGRLPAYLFMSIGSLFFLVLFKLWVAPFALQVFFPQSDLVSQIYEIVILLLGGLTFLLFTIMGYAGKHFFEIGMGKHMLLHLVIQLPFTVHAVLQEVSIPTSDMGMIHILAEGWCGLISEPTRLVFMVYPWTDIFAIVISFVFLLIGRNIEIVGGEKPDTWGKFKNRMKVGKA